MFDPHPADRHRRSGSISLSPNRHQPRTSVVLRRLSAARPVGAEAEALLLSLGDLQNHRAGVELVNEREGAPRPRFLVAGWAARVRWLPDGRRQIFNFILPGEGIGLSLRPNPLAASTVIALTSVQTVDAQAVQKALSSSEARWDGLRDAIHLAASYEQAYLLAQVMRLGRQTAYERIGHLLLELRERLVAVGIGEDARFPMPLTQEILADATGLSIVHVNRILQQLRRERLLDLQSGQVRLLDRAQLEAIADYRPPAMVSAVDQPG